MFKKIALSTLFIAMSAAVHAESFPPKPGAIDALSSGNNGFTYPVQTHLDSDAIVHDVVFFYSKDLLDYFGNDVEILEKYVNHAIEINNTGFKRQDIPLRRRIAGVVPFPEDLNYQDNVDNEDRMNSNGDTISVNVRFEKLSQLFTLPQYNFKSYYEDASYRVAINRYYPEVREAIGLAVVSGNLSWVSPLSPEGKASNTLSHELGHNDGFLHDKESLAEYTESMRRFVAAPYSVGQSCGAFDSIMKSGFGNRAEAFFSDPQVQNAQNEACGTHDVADAARAYKEAAAPGGKMEQRVMPFVNNRPTRPVAGTVGMSFPSTTVAEGQPLAIDVIWTGAKQHDSVSIITRKGTAGLDDFKSTLEVVYFDGINMTQRVELATLDDDEFELDETYSVELIYPTGVEVDSSARLQEITLTSEDLGQPGVINFTTGSVTIVEGQSATLTLNRTNGSDGTVVVNVIAENGTANDADYRAFNQAVTFLNGELSKTITITINSDTEAEPAETFTVKITGDNGIIGTQNAVSVTIPASSAPANNGGDTGGGTNTGSGSGGGSMGYSVLGLLLLASLRRRRTR